MYVRITRLLKQASLSLSDLLYLMPGVAPSSVQFYLKKLQQHGFITRIDGEYYLISDKQVLGPCKRCKCLVLSWTLDSTNRCKQCQPEQTLSFVAQVFPNKANHSFVSKLMQTSFKPEEMKKLCDEMEV